MTTPASKAATAAPRGGSLPDRGKDYVSMGWHAARKLRRSVDNLRRVLAIELLAAARAIDLRAPLKPSEPSARVISVLRNHVDPPGPDRFLAPAIEVAVHLIQSGEILDAAGPLQ